MTEPYYGHLCSTWFPWDDTCPGCNPPSLDPFEQLCNELHALIEVDGQRCPEPDGNPLCARLAQELITAGWHNDKYQRPRTALEIFDE